MTTVAMHHNPPSLFERLLFHAAWALAYVVLVHIGWLALEPRDPTMPVSLLFQWRRPVIFLEILALSAVLSSLATALAGRRHVDVGAFSVSLGLLAVSFKGGSMTQVLMAGGESRALCFALALDCVLWSTAIFVALLAGGFVARWLGAARTTEANAHERDSFASMLESMAAPRIPWLGRRVFPDVKTEGLPSVAHGVKHFLVTVALTLLLIGVFSAGTGDRMIRHGQACFAVAAAFYLAVGRAQAYYPTASTFWTLLSIPAVGILAYVIAFVQSFPTMFVGGLFTAPASGYLRILPVTYICAGTVACLFAHGSVRGRIETRSSAEDR